MKLSRDYIKRMMNTKDGGSSGAGGGLSSAQLASMLSGMASEEWVNDNYLSIEFFNRIFTIYGDNDVVVEPNDMNTAIENIQSMFGFWTEFYLTALGNGGHVGDAIYLSSLADVSVAGVQSGQVLTWNSSQGKWVATTPQSGVDMVTVWNALSAGTNQQINGSHLTTALSGYATQSWVGQQGFATQTWVGQQGFATTTWVSNNYLPLAGGTMNSNARISLSSNLYIGNSDSAGWVRLANVCSQSGDSYWKIYVSGNATFANVLSNGYVTALSDEREKRIIEHIEVPLEYIAQAPMVSYEWKDERDNLLHVGSIAQYWLEELPELIPLVNDRYTMDYGRIALISAITIARHVVNLEERIAELENRLKV